MMIPRWLLAVFVLAAPGTAQAERAAPATRPVPGQAGAPAPGSGPGSGKPLMVRAQPGPVAPPHPSGAAVIELLEDDAARLVRSLHSADQESLCKAGAWGDDCFSGVCSLKLAGYQRFREDLPGWIYPITEKPRPGEYRYLRFAWKRPEGRGVMLQLALASGDWGRYFAGENSVGFYPALQVNPSPPREWEVVTRDLWEDFGRVPFTLTGMAFTSMDGVGLFDHVYLGRTIEDLDRVTEAARHWTTRIDFLGADRVAQYWKDVASEDAAVRQPTVWALGACGGTSSPFVVKQVPVPDAAAMDRRIARAVAALDAPRFAIREQASKDLEQLGLTALPQLEFALAKPDLSAEWRTRLEKLVRKVKLDEPPLTESQRLTLRAIHILEQAETATAKARLADLAKGGLEAGLSAEAKAALERLEKRRR